MLNPWKRVKELTNANNILSNHIVELSEKITKRNIELVELTKKIEIIEKKIGDPKEVVKKMLGRPIKFTDISKMSKEAYNNYYRDAQEIVKNETFLSELNSLTVDLVNSAAKDADDFRQVLNRRFTLCGVQLLKQRIEDLAKAEDKEVEDEEELYENL